jgi:hypothetical protein
MNITFDDCQVIPHKFFNGMHLGFLTKTQNLFLVTNLLDKIKFVPVKP